MQGCLIGNQIERYKNLTKLLKQKKEELIAESDNFQELFEVLDRIGSLKEIVDNGSDMVCGTNKIYNIAEIKEIIGKVQKKPDDINYVTRELGLRQKVIELINKNK